MYEGKFPHKRYQKTLEFLKEHTPAPASVLDLGATNPFVNYMKQKGYTVTNTNGEDLDVHTEAVLSEDYDMVTAFEIFEHLISPYTILKDIKAT